MSLKKINKKIVAGCICTTLLFTGCSSVSFDELYNSVMKEQTSENGDEKKEEKEEERKNDGYDMKYSGKIEGKASYIKVTSGDGKVAGEGSGTYEWITDSLVKVTFDKKEDGKEKVIIADQTNVTITMLDVKEDDKKSAVSEILEDREKEREELLNQ